MDTHLRMTKQKESRILQTYNTQDDIASWVEELSEFDYAESY